MCTHLHPPSKHIHTHSTCTDLQHHLVEVDPVHQEVVMWSVREDSQHAGYMQTVVAHSPSDTEHKLGMGKDVQTYTVLHF